MESVISERALREIYLRGFEIAVKEGRARSIMTSYNPLNGYWTASNYDLVTTILRSQWGYTGLVMSDWWAEGNDRGGAGSTKHVAAMVRAQNDVFMVVTDPEHNSGGGRFDRRIDGGMPDARRIAAQRGEHLPLFVANARVPPQYRPHERTG